MINFFVSQFYFFFILVILIFLPGFFLLSLIFSKNKFSILEKFILSIPVSFSFLTLIMIIAGRLGLLFTKTNLWVLFIILNLILIFSYFFLKKRDKDLNDEDNLIYFSKKQTYLIIILIFLTVFIKSTYLMNTIFPTSTDLAHHMFWVQKIVKTEKLPNYQEKQIEVDVNKNIILTEPENIADFIVGEHLIFAVISILSNKDIISSFPSLVLFIFNLTSILTIFILSLRLFEKYKFNNWVAIFVLFFMGPLYAISSSQTKFVSGGVIGNVVGDLFIPTIFYFVYRAFANKNSSMLMMVIFLIAGISYTHHLSTFIFLFGMIFSSALLFLLQVNLDQLFESFFQKKSLIILSILFIIFYLINFFIEKFNLPLNLIFIISLLGDLFILSFFQKEIKDWIKEIFSSVIKIEIFVLIVFFAFMFLVFYVPSYLNKEAIGSATGTPEKSTRLGIPFNELMYMSGEARFILGLIGLMILFLIIILIKNKKTSDYFYNISPANKYGLAVLVGWTSAILIMSLSPHLLKVNIISSRISNYIITPLTILAGFTIVWVFDLLHQRRTNKTYLPKNLISITFTLVTLFVLTNGMKDNALSLKLVSNIKEAIQTYSASGYISKSLKKDSQMIKDHNYIEGDAFIKIFFAKENYDSDFGTPLSRSFLQRYETNPSRETCTLKMISEPNSLESQKCFNSLNVSAVMVQTNHDAAQFNSLDNFYRIYQNDELSIYFRKN